MQNLFDLSGRNIVITGAAGLLGRRHVEAVAAFGGNPILLDLDLSAAQKIADQVNKQFTVKASAWQVNICDEQAIRANLQAVLDQYGSLDGLVNNAANNPKVEDNSPKSMARLENFDLAAWNDDLAVGLTGSFLCAKYYGAAIAENQRGGSIVNISSDLGLIAPDQRLYSQANEEPENQPVKPVTYSVVKSGLIGLTRYLATYWPDKNIRCNALCPGGIENGQDAAFIAKISDKIPMGRLAKPDEYQGALIFMLSDASSYMNGAVVAIDGGRTAW